MLALPVIAALVILLVLFRLFTDPIVIAVIFVLYVAVSLRNKRKFKKQEERGKAEPGTPRAEAPAGPLRKP